NRVRTRAGAAIVNRRPERSVEAGRWANQFERRPSTLAKLDDRRRSCAGDGAADRRGTAYQDLRAPARSILEPARRKRAGNANAIAREQVQGPAAPLCVLWSGAR